LLPVLATVDFVTSVYRALMCALLTGR